MEINSWEDCTREEQDQVDAKNKTKIYLIN